MTLWITLIVAATVAVGWALFSGAQFGADLSTPTQNNHAQSAQFSDGKFRNTVPLEGSGLGFSKTLETLYEWTVNRAKRKPPQEPPVKKLVSLKVGDGNAHVTWLGHSTLLVEIDNTTILTDPVFSNHASPFTWLPPASFYKTMPITPDQIDHIDVVVISHDHYDHLDHQSIVALKDKVGRFVVPLGVGEHLKLWGVDSTKITELDWWQAAYHNTLTLTATPAQHFSGRRMTGGNQTLWSGWAIRGRNENIFFGGDSGYFDGFKEIGRNLGPFDLTMLECGAYNEAWANVHMMPEQTAKAHRDLNGKALLPIHWGRFDLALHGWDEPIQRLLAATGIDNSVVVTPLIGERFQVASPLPQHQWWKSNEKTTEASPTPDGIQFAVHMSSQLTYSTDE
jgi:L-ascorbate metabolism protein UlaG (beta-lactamase superfamily)